VARSSQVDRSWIFGYDEEEAAEKMFSDSSDEEDLIDKF
jgi:hypothetical protein